MEKLIPIIPRINSFYALFAFFSFLLFLFLSTLTVDSSILSTFPLKVRIQLVRLVMLFVFAAMILMIILAFNYLPGGNDKSHKKEEKEIPISLKQKISEYQLRRNRLINCVEIKSSASIKLKNCDNLEQYGSLELNQIVMRLQKAEYSVNQVIKQYKIKCD